MNPYKITEVLTLSALIFYAIIGMYILVMTIESPIYIKIIIISISSITITIDLYKLFYYTDRYRKLIEEKEVIPISMPKGKHD